MRHPPAPNYRRFYDINGWAFISAALGRPTHSRVARALLARRG